MVGVAAGEGAFAVSLERAAATDLFVVGVLAEGVCGTAAGGINVRWEFCGSGLDGWW